jgi:SAM-dependent methyltransferase
MGMITFLKEHTPWAIRRIVRNFKRRLAAIEESRLTTKEVFTKIYAENLWGERSTYDGSDFPYYSGPGSKEETTSPYVDCVNKFIETKGVRSVVDIGCGDFRVGSRIAHSSINYIGIDIVESLVQASQIKFGAENIMFRCLDITVDELPDGDLCLVREVFQHLSNAAISSVLSKARKYKWVIVTENLPGPIGSFKPNRDKPNGRDGRCVWNSGIVLSAPPFKFPNVELILEIAAPNAEFGTAGNFSTFLIRMNQSGLV